MEDEVKLTKWGYGIRTSSDDCISAINEFYDQVLSYGRRRSVILEATVHDKDCVLANVLAAHFLSSSDSSRAHYHLQAAKAGVDRATPYEKAVFDAISYLMSNDRDDNVAVELHTELLKNFPKDLSSLKRAQVLCFYLGSDDLSLALVEQHQSRDEFYRFYPKIKKKVSFMACLLFLCWNLAAWKKLKRRQEGDLISTRKIVGHSMRYAMFFSIGVILKKRLSLWRHARLLGVTVDHSCMYIKLCRLVFLSNGFVCFLYSVWKLSIFRVTHNWWHVALCYLEANSPPSKILELYDNYIWKELEKPDAMGPEVYLNALGLMLRLFVRGEFDPCEGRLKILANVLTDKANWHLEWHFDILTSWALAKAGETFAADKLLGSLKSRLLKMTSKKREKMQRGVLLAEALYKYGRGDYEHALDLLGLDFDANDYKMIGASNEQLDVFNEVWYDILMNTGHTAKAIEVIEKQAKRREEVPYLWHLLERGYNKIGRPEEAAIAGDKARSLEKAHFK